MKLLLNHLLGADDAFSGDPFGVEPDLLLQQGNKTKIIIAMIFAGPTFCYHETGMRAECFL